MKAMEKVIYCISGLGADHLIFKNLKVNDADLRHLPWLKPYNKEPVESYASRMKAGIAHQSPVILGVSFGGMITIEIARQMKVKKGIVVSGVKTRDELPAWMRMSGKLYLNKILPVRSNRITRKFNNSRLGVSNDEEEKLAENYRQSADPAYLDWAINAVLNWKNSYIPDNVKHIHGDRDRIFPIRNIVPDYVVSNGTHLMIYNRAEEISSILLKELNE